MSEINVNESRLLWSIDQNGNKDGKVDQADTLNDLDGVAANPRDGKIDANERQVLRDVAGANGVSEAFMDRLADIANGSGEVLDVPAGYSPEPPAPRSTGVGMRRRPGQG
ncbi:MAG: hypothetical protein AAF658_14405 [Myxococcota bacterium]